MEANVKTLRRVSLFSGLSGEALTRIARVAIRRTYDPDQTIILKGMPCEAAYFIAEGEVRALRTSPAGREQVLARLGRGQSFNTVPPFQQDGVNHATVRAVGVVEIYAVPVEELRRLVSECPELALAILQDFAGRLDHLTDLVENLALYTVRGRLARFLLNHADAGQVKRRWTQAEIAARLGTVRDMVGRTLRAFADAGLIRMDRQRIVLLNRAGLEEEAQR